MTGNRKKNSIGRASVSKPGKTGKGRKDKAVAPTSSPENLTSASTDTSPEVMAEQGQGNEGELVRLFEVEGFAAVALPAQVREILGKEVFVQRVAELGDYEFTVILRHPGQIIHVNLPIYVGVIEHNDQGQLMLKSLTPTVSAEKAAQRAWPEAARSAIIAKLEKS